MVEEKMTAEYLISIPQSSSTGYLGHSWITEMFIRLW